MYSRQLHAYAYTLEHPALGKLVLSPVTKLGLLYFYPAKIYINQQSIDRLNYGAEIVWVGVEVEKDEEDFLSFIDEVLNVLELPEAPEHLPNCQWCSYISRLNST
jgi:hypothetical protein